MRKEVIRSHCVFTNMKEDVWYKKDEKDRNEFDRKTDWWRMKKKFWAGSFERNSRDPTLSPGDKRQSIIGRHIEIWRNVFRQTSWFNTSENSEPEKRISRNISVVNRVLNNKLFTVYLIFSPSNKMKTLRLNILIDLGIVESNRILSRVKNL